MGAAVIAGVGAGIFSDYSAHRLFRHPKDETQPDMEAHRYYQRRLEEYKACYSALKDVFPKL